MLGEPTLGLKISTKVNDRNQALIERAIKSFVRSGLSRALVHPNQRAFPLVSVPDSDTAQSAKARTVFRVIGRVLVKVINGKNLPASDRNGTMCLHRLSALALGRDAGPDAAPQSGRLWRRRRRPFIRLFRSVCACHCRTSLTQDRVPAAHAVSNLERGTALVRPRPVHPPPPPAGPGP